MDLASARTGIPRCARVCAALDHVHPLQGHSGPEHVLDKGLARLGVCDPLPTLALGACRAKQGLTSAGGTYAPSCSMLTSISNGHQPVRGGVGIRFGVQPHGAVSMQHEAEPQNVSQTHPSLGAPYIQPTPAVQRGFHKPVGSYR